MNIHSVSEVTPQLRAAMAHVKSIFPTLHIVVFNLNGRWQYMDTDFNAFKFDDRIDVSILEAASDSIDITPAVFCLDSDF